MKPTPENPGQQFVDLSTNEDDVNSEDEDYVKHDFSETGVFDFNDDQLAALRNCILILGSVLWADWWLYTFECKKKKNLHKYKKNLGGQGNFAAAVPLPHAAAVYVAISSSQVCSACSARVKHTVLGILNIL